MVPLVQEKPSTGRTEISLAVVQDPSLGYCQNQIYWTRGEEKTDGDTGKGKVNVSQLQIRITFASRCPIHLVTITHLLGTGVVGCRAM